MTEILVLPRSRILGAISQRRYAYLDRDLRRHAAHQLLNRQLDGITSLLRDVAFDFEIIEGSKQIKIHVY